MSYKVEKPRNAPDWFVPGIVCNVMNYDDTKEVRRIIIWCEMKRARPFYDSDGVRWQMAAPIELCEPVECEDTEWL